MVAGDEFTVGTPSKGTAQMQTAPQKPESRSIARTRDFLKQIVFGGNDGIVTTFAIVAGFAGAQADGTAQIGGIAVLVFGLANLFADAVSMGLGEFLSLRSRHAMYRTRRSQFEGTRSAATVRRFLLARGVAPPLTFSLACSCNAAARATQQRRRPAAQRLPA